MRTRGIIFLRRDVAGARQAGLLSRARVLMRGKGFCFCTEIFGDDAASLDTLIHTVTGPRPAVVAVGSLAHVSGGCPPVSRLAELRWWAEVCDVETGAVWAALPRPTQRPVHAAAVVGPGMQPVGEQVDRTPEQVRAVLREWGGRARPLGVGRRGVRDVVALSQPERSVLECLVVGQPRRTRDIARQLGVSDDHARYLLDCLRRRDYAVSHGQAGWLPTEFAAAARAQVLGLAVSTAGVHGGVGR